MSQDYWSLLKAYENHPLTLWEHDLRIVARAARIRARKSKRPCPCDDDLEALVRELFLAQGGVCAISKLPFDRHRAGIGQAKRPLYPSLDQKKPGIGYVRGNVRIVLQFINFAMNAYGNDIYLIEIAKAIAKNHATRVQPLQLPEKPCYWAPRGAAEKSEGDLSGTPA